MSVKDLAGETNFYDPYGYCQYLQPRRPVKYDNLMGKNLGQWAIPSSRMAFSMKSSMQASMFDSLANTIDMGAPASLGPLSNSECTECSSR